MINITAEWSEIYERLRGLIKENILDADQQEELQGELIELLSVGQKNVILLKGAEKKLSREPNNIIIRSEHSNTLKDSIRSLLEAEIIYDKLDLLIRRKEVMLEKGKTESFEDELHNFKEYVESDGIDVFWEKRKEEKFGSNPETKAHVLYAAFFAGKVGRGKVLREVQVGSGRIDAIQIYQGQLYGIEMKMLGGRYGTKYAKDGIKQLFVYLKGKDLQVGYLLIFDGRLPQKKSEVFNARIRKEGLAENGRKIFPIIVDINPVAPSKIGKIKDKN